jgi:transposase-like protein
MNFPSTLLEATRYFSSEENCHNFMVSMRWADGRIICPHCLCQCLGKLVVTTRETPDRTLKSGKFVKGQTLTRRLWNCGACKKQFTAKVGTIFEDSPLGLDKWLPAVWLIVNAKNGISSYEIHRALGITQKSAWFMGHRIRTALHEGNFMKMSGQVEVDETYIGAKSAAMNKKAKRNKPSGTGMVGKTVVQGLLERTTATKSSRVQAAVVASARREHVLPPVVHSVEI